MAALEKIRNKAVLLVAVIGIALFAFIIGDFLNSGSTWFHQSKETVIDVNGTAVKIHDYDAKLQETMEGYKNQMGGNIPDEYVGQIRQEVYDRTVMEILLNEESEELGLSVTPEELFDMVQGENISPVVRNIPAFMNRAGVFDRDRMLQFLQHIETTDFSNMSQEQRAEIENDKKQWLLVEKQLKQNRLAEKFGALVSRAIVVNSIDAKAAYENNKTSVDFDFAMQAYASIPDSSVVVSSKEIEVLYNKRKELFDQPEGRIIKYIAVPIVPSKEDYAEVEKTMNSVKSDFIQNEDVADVMNDNNSDIPYVDAYLSAASLSANVRTFAQNAQIGDVEGPTLVGTTYHLLKLIGKTTGADSVKVNLMPLPNVAEKEQKQYSDSLVNLIKTGNQTFSQVVLAMTNGRMNGDLGWLTEESAIETFDATFKNAVFNAPVNEFMHYKATSGQSFIYQVVQRTSSVTKYKVADFAIAVTPSTTTETGLYNDLSRYVVENNTLDKFESSANEKGYICNKDVVVTATDNNLGNMRDTRKVIRWAFDHKKGEMSEIYECDSRNYVVAMMEGVQKEGYRSLESVSELLKRELINDKKAEKITADLNAKKLSSLQQYAEAMNTTIQSVKFVNFDTRMISGIGFEPSLNAEASIIELNKISNPVKGNNGVYVIQATNKTVDNKEFNLTEQRESLDPSLRYRVMGGIITALKDNAKITDNRVRFY